MNIDRSLACTTVFSLFLSAALVGCFPHASDADKAAAAEAGASRQQQADEAAAAQRGVHAAQSRLEELPPPSKSRYMSVHTVQTWSNPFLVVGRRTITLRFSGVTGDVLPNNVLPGTKLKPVGAGKQEVAVRLIDLPEALASLTEESWPYGRVIAVEEDPATPRAERPQMRRNVEAVMAMMNDLDVVVNEWPGGLR